MYEINWGKPSLSYLITYFELFFFTFYVDAQALVCSVLEEGKRSRKSSGYAGAARVFSRTHSRTHTPTPHRKIKKPSIYRSPARRKSNYRRRYKNIASRISISILQAICDVRIYDAVGTSIMYVFTFHSKAAFHGSSSTSSSGSSTGGDSSDDERRFERRKAKSMAKSRQRLVRY